MSMSNVIVKYHNDLNKISLPSFTEQEQNMLFSILSRIKETDGKNIRLFQKDIIVDKLKSAEYFTEVMDSLKNKFFKASFRQIVETETEFIDSYFHLFNTMNIHYRKKNPDDGNDTSKIFECIDLEVNAKFLYLINELTANFTRFELAEFVSLSGKYTKTLYRLLKQYRHTGNMRMGWQEFLHIMDIPKDYTQTNMDKWILKPAIKELTKEKNLFDGTRIPFKNLSYTKLKGKGRGRGGNVIGIEFSFEIEQRYESRLILDQRAEQMEKTIHDLNEHELKKLKTKYEDIDFETDKGESMKIFNLSINKDTKHIEVTFKNRENNTTYTNTYENLSKLNGYLSKFGVIMK